MRLKSKVLGRADALAHAACDRYIDNHRPGWQLLQLATWHICQAYEDTLR